MPDTISDESGSTRYITRYTISDDGTYYTAIKYKQQKKGLVIKRWEDTGEKEVLANVPYAENPNVSIAIPNQYPVTTPAQIVVNGTLNFGNGAAFAGKISEGSGVIKATSEVVDCTIPEGFTFGTGTSAVWYYTCVKGLYKNAVLVGETQSNIAVGTYEYKSVTESGVTISGWFKQP